MAGHIRTKKGGVKLKRIKSFLIMLVMILTVAGVGAASVIPETSVTTITKDTAAKSKKNKSKKKNTDQAKTEDNAASSVSVTEDGTYTSKDEVAAYIHLFGHLPSNYITKKEAKKLGWISTEGNLWDVAPGKSIGGDYFGNYEGQLPEAKGREYRECDIDFTGSRRNAKRIIFSNDGLIFYTEDHYTTFEQLY